MVLVEDDLVILRMVCVFVYCVQVVIWSRSDFRDLRQARIQNWQVKLRHRIIPPPSLNRLIRILINSINHRHPHISLRLLIPRQWFFPKIIHRSQYQILLLRWLTIPLKSPSITIRHRFIPPRFPQNIEIFLLRKRTIIEIDYFFRRYFDY